MPQALKPLCLIHNEKGKFSQLPILALWGNKNGLPSMKVKELEKIPSKIALRASHPRRREAPSERSKVVVSTVSLSKPYKGSCSAVSGSGLSIILPFFPSVAPLEIQRKRNVYFWPVSPSVPFRRFPASLSVAILFLLLGRESKNAVIGLLSCANRKGGKNP